MCLSSELCLMEGYLTYNSQIKMHILKKKLDKILIINQYKEIQAIKRVEGANNCVFHR